MVGAEPDWKEEERKELLDSGVDSPASPPLEDVKLELGYYAADEEQRADGVAQEDKKAGRARLLVWMTINIIATVAIVCGMLLRSKTGTDRHRSLPTSPFSPMRLSAIRKCRSQPTISPLRDSPYGSHHGLFVAGSNRSMCLPIASSISSRRCASRSSSRT